VALCRRAFAERGYAEARQLLGAAPGREGESPWLRLTRLWEKRLDEALQARAERRKKLEDSLPKGVKLHLWEDFEEGPELVPLSWRRGETVTPPQGSPATNR